MSRNSMNACIAETFTPGPWAAFTDGNHTNIVAVVPRTAVVFSLPGRDKSEPDVRLATAAPELLEIVETIELGLKRGYTPSELLDENSPIRDRIRAALAKAGVV